MRKLLLAAMAALTLLPLAAAPASAAVCDKNIRLVATAAGANANADGRARLRSDDRNRQSLRVEITVAFRDGTPLSVTANGIAAGTAVVIVGRAVLDLNNRVDPLPAGLDPVCSITQIAVSDPAGTVILTGSF